jgi:hypothetical protein
MPSLAWIPWGRMVHWRGRAHDVPDLVRSLWDDDAQAREEARERLASSLERQEGLSQATPFATLLLLSALRDPALPDKAALVAVLGRIAAAAAFQLRSHDPAAALSLEDLLAPAHLRPAFVSRAADEAWQPSPGEFDAYHVVTAQALVAARRFMKGLGEEDSVLQDAVAPLLAAIDALPRSRGG